MVSRLLGKLDAMRQRTLGLVCASTGAATLTAAVAAKLDLRSCRLFMGSCLVDDEVKPTARRMPENKVAQAKIPHF
jgi:hypothetical protein